MRSPKIYISENGLLQQLTKALVERVLNGEMMHHLGYEKHSAGNNSGNSRNSSTPKVLKGKRGCKAPMMDTNLDYSFRVE